MRRWSLRLRLTVLVTVAVGLALAAASVALVTAVSRSLVGDVEAAAAAAVDEVAADLVAGRTPDAFVPAESLSLVQIQDEDGQVVQQIPESPGQALTLDELPPEVRDARAAAGDEPDTVRPSDDVVLAWRTVSTPDGTRTVLALSRLGPVTAGVTVVVDALVVAAPLLTLFVGALTWFAVGRALRPVETIRRRAEAISHSTLAERLPAPGTRDEVARLTGTLNEMLDRIDDGARRQREFVADASHELRTPLTAMRADLEVALTGRGTDWPATARRLLDDHRRLDRLTGDLLLLARLDDRAGRAHEEVRFDEVVAGELPAVRRVGVEVELAPVVVRGAVPELTRMVRNLLDNADRYATARVVVRLSAGQGTAVLTVDDDGPGVPAAQRDRVFDRFFRLDQSRARASGGAGLGLAMVRRIAQGHGGDVTVGVAPSGGARFTVTLPAFSSRQGAPSQR